MSLRDSLDGIKVVDLGTALPGPLAAARLAEMGATVKKIEPPWGDLLKKISASWYLSINQSKRICVLDLKTPEGQAELAAELSQADLAITTMRPTALERLDLDSVRVSERFPRLCWVAIVGQLPPLADLSGHDLTYQASAGLLRPPRVPRFLLADVIGAEQAVQVALAQLLQREQTGTGSWEWVSLTAAAEVFRPVLEHGLTSPGQILGGGNPRYGYYRVRDGWITLAALENRLWRQLVSVLERPDLAEMDGEDLKSELQRLFRDRSMQDWQELASRHQLPIQPIRTKDER